MERIDALIIAFRALRSAQSAQRLEAIRGLLTDWNPPRPRPAVNVFSLLDLTSDEVRHSRFLAWLLDAEGEHQQGNLFMRAFARGCALDIAEDKMERYRVRTEISGRESVVDIMAYRFGEFVIFVENKIHAEEGPGQLAREFRDMRRISNKLRVSEDRQYAVFLTPDGRQPVSARGTQWVTLSHSRLAEVLEKALSEVTDGKVRTIVEDWIEAFSSRKEGARMTEFSEEDRLLIEDWDTVEDLLEAVEALREKLFAVLESIGPDLRATDWWHDGWVLVGKRKEELYMSNQAWRSDGDYAVWIGVEEFTPDAVFGSGTPPVLYVWVSGKRYELKRQIAEAIVSGEHDMAGEVDRDPGSVFVVRTWLSKCLPEDVGSYADTVREETVAFFAHYANVLTGLDDIIQGALGSQQ